MPLVTMPDGSTIQVEEGTPQSVIDEIKKQYPASRKTAVAAGQSRVDLRSYGGQDADVQDRIRKRVEAYNKTSRYTQNGFGDFTGSMMNLGGLGPLVANTLEAATVGTFNAVRKGDIGEIGRQYQVAAGAQNEEQRQRDQRSPILSTAGDVGGSLLVPIGGEARFLGKGGQLLEKAGLERAAGALTRAGEYTANSGPIGRAIIAGAEQGALSGAGRADSLSDLPGNALLGGGLGGAFGGALGTAGHLGARGIQMFKDARSGNAGNLAYQRIANMLDNGKLSPDAARSEIAATDAGGGDAMVQDLLPSLRSQAAYLSRKPGVPSSNDLIERGEQRIADRRANFGENAQNYSGINKDAFDRGDELNATRREAGKQDYAEGGALDAPIQWNEGLDNFFKDAPENTQRSLRGAYDDMLARRENPANLFKIDEAGNVNYIPNMRTFDYLKRRFDADIGGALKAGDRPQAQALSGELSQLKSLLADANPQYMDVLSTQRDLFQKTKALEIGQNVLGRMSREPRAVLRDLKALRDEDVMDARVGIIDALVNSDTKADPIGFYTSISRNPAQKKVLEFAFGGKGNLGRFDKYVTREVRSRRSDVLTAPGRQSETSRVQLAGDEAENTGNVLNNALRGYAFGGVAGAASGVIRTLQNISTGSSKLVQDEIAKILLSKGEGLEKGVAAAREYAKRRQASNIRRSVVLSRVAADEYAKTL